MDSDSVRDFIRSMLDDKRRTIEFLEEAAPGDQMFYDPDEVWDSAMDLVEWLDVDLTADKDLRFFVVGDDGDVAAAAFTNCNESTFGFEIVSDPDYDHYRDELVRDCLEDYDYFRSGNSELVLEIGDLGMVEVLQEQGFKIMSSSANNKLLSE